MKEEKGVPRHAKVVPAFLAADIRRSLESWIGVVQPMELLRWERKSDLTDSARRDLRLAIVKRTRPRSERYWSQAVGVRLTEGWGECLNSDERKRLKQLQITCDRPLQIWTLREVKEALHLSLEQTLGILAKLEALYWEPPPAGQRRALELDEEYGPPVSVTDELCDLASEALLLPWLIKVSPDDMRFNYGGEPSLPEWIRTQIAGTSASSKLPGLLRRLLRAEKLTAEDEARELADAAAVQCAARNDPRAAQRWAEMLMRRYIAPSGVGRTLAEVGIEFGVTRERIRQICESFEDLFGEAEICTPALDRVLLGAARIAPIAIDEADEQLRRFIGDGAGIESLIEWAAMVRRDDPPVCCRRVRVRIRGDLAEVTMVQIPDAPEWVEAMLRHVSRDSSMLGCTNILRIAGRLALKEGLAPGQESMETALEGTSQFRWLDKESGWFTLGDSSGSSAAVRVRKIMAVAEETVGTDEIAAALASDDQWMYRETSSLGLATPPVHVLRELFRGWPWLKVVQKGRFVPSESFDRLGALTDVEEACVDVIAAHQGVACRFELKEAVVVRMGFSDVLLAAVLGSSPIFDRLEHGLYRLIGRRVGDGAVNSARVRSRMRYGVQIDMPADMTGNEFVSRITEASLRHEQYAVPPRFIKRLAGKFHPVKSSGGELIGEVRVTQSGAMAGLNRLFQGVKPGDYYRIEVLDDGLQVRHVAPISEHQDPMEFEIPDGTPESDWDASSYTPATTA